MPGWVVGSGVGSWVDGLRADWRVDREVGGQTDDGCCRWVNDSEQSSGWLKDGDYAKEA